MTYSMYVYICTVRLAHPVTEILLQPGGSEATLLVPSKLGGRRSVHGSQLVRIYVYLTHHDLVLTLFTEDALRAVHFLVCTFHTFSINCCSHALVLLP